VTPYERQVLTLWRRGLSLGQIAVATGRPCSGWYVTGLERREARRERQALRERILAAPPRDEVEAAVERLGVAGAATHYGVSRATLRYWRMGS
jgi:hypothetical protein